MYSRTDQRGVVTSGNYVFQRVCNHPWADLIGAPHKLVRHPDMPQGLFHILWERIKTGEATGAYIKNRAKDGLHYWTYVQIAPARDGFLSVCIQPSSARFATIKALYAQVRKAEQEDGQSPQDSAEMIRDALRAEGFDTYRDFAATALSEELLSERDRLGVPQCPVILEACGMLDIVHDLKVKAANLMHDFNVLISVPRNLQIKAKVLEPVGGPLTALSNDYGRMSQEMSDWFEKHVIGEDDNIVQIAIRVKDVLLSCTTAELMTRCIDQLTVEARSLGGTNIEDETRRLNDQAIYFRDVAAKAQMAISNEAARLSKACQEMRRTLMGLNMVRVTGKIENARIADQANSLGEVIALLGQSQRRVEDHMEKVRTCIEEIGAASQRSDTAQHVPLPSSFMYAGHA